MLTLREKKGLVWERCKGKCVYCGKQMLRFGRGFCRRGAKVHPLTFTVDHVLPKVHGGTNDLSNLVGACYQCNHNKGCAVPREAK